LGNFAEGRQAIREEKSLFKIKKKSTLLKTTVRKIKVRVTDVRTLL